VSDVGNHGETDVFIDLGYTRWLISCLSGPSTLTVPTLKDLGANRRNQRNKRCRLSTHGGSLAMRFKHVVILQGLL
jgi:hypothetical protein